MTGHLRLVKPAGPKPPKKGRLRPYQSDLFSPEEAARLLAALKNARAMFGTFACLADAMRVPLTTIGAVKARVPTQVFVDQLVREYEASRAALAKGLGFVRKQTVTA